MAAKHVAGQIINYPHSGFSKGDFLAVAHLTIAMEDIHWRNPGRKDSCLHQERVTTPVPPFTTLHTSDGSMWAMSRLLLAQRHSGDGHATLQV